MREPADLACASSCPAEPWRKKNPLLTSPPPPRPPSLPHPLCRQRDEENGIRDSEGSPSLQPPSVTSSRGCRGAQTRTNNDTRGRKIARISPNSPPNARSMGDLKGQIRCFLTLSARSLPVFAEPNASPSGTSVYPLLYHLPPFSPSLSPSFSLLPSDDSTSYSGTPE